MNLKKLIEGNDLNFWIYMTALVLSAVAVYVFPLNKGVLSFGLYMFAVTAIAYILFPWTKEVLNKKPWALDIFIEKVFIFVVSFTLFYPIGVIIRTTFSYLLSLF